MKEKLAEIKKEINVIKEEKKTKIYFTQQEFLMYQEYISNLEKELDLEKELTNNDKKFQGNNPGYLVQINNGVSSLKEAIKQARHNLLNSVVVEEASNTTEVRIGDTLVLSFLDSKGNDIGDEEVLQLSSINFGSSRGRFSVAAPLGKAIIGKEVGDVVSYMADKAKLQVLIKEKVYPEKSSVKTNDKK